MLFKLDALEILTCIGYGYTLRPMGPIKYIFSQNGVNQIFLGYGK